MLTKDHHPKTNCKCASLHSDKPFQFSLLLIPSARTSPSHSNVCTLLIFVVFDDWCPVKLFNSCILTSVILERNRTVTIKQNNSTKKSKMSQGNQSTRREQNNTCSSNSSCFFFSASTAMLNNLASLKKKGKKRIKLVHVHY